MSSESLFAECVSCKKLFLNSVSVCPQCGRKRRRFTAVQIGVGTLGVLVIIGWLSSKNENGTRLTNPPTEESKRSPSPLELKEAVRMKIGLDYTWRRSGFGSIMEADFAIKNNSNNTIKDVEIQCNHYAKSGTKIDSNSRSIYDAIGANTTKNYYNFNMGFIHDQVNTTSCTVKNISLGGTQ